MSDNDLIKRGDVADKAFDILKMLTGAEQENKIDRVLFSLLYHDIGAIAFLPAVPHEMSAREYEKVLSRFMWSDDAAQNHHLAARIAGNYEEAVAIVEKWAREHPEHITEGNE